MRHSKKNRRTSHLEVATQMELNRTKCVRNDVQHFIPENSI